MSASLGHGGRFITLEGGEGSGKTTLIAKLARYLEQAGYQVMTTREPGGVDIAEQIRAVVLDPANTAMEARTEALLYAAARRQHLTEKVLPSLERGEVVLCDRFLDSSLAYQGHARGIGLEQVLSINTFAIGQMMPDTTFYLDVPPEQGLLRITSNQQRESNRLDREELAFHQRIHEGYRIIAGMFPERIITIAADGSPEEVFALVVAAWKQRYPGDGKRD